MNAPTLCFNVSIDCEATQPAVNDADLGRRAVEGFAAALEAHGLRGTFHVLPGDAEAMPALYRQLHERGHEIGLHVHPAAQGYQEFLGVYGRDMQRTILAEAIDRFSAAVGFFPATFCPGYVSTNDATYGVLYELGFRHGMCSMPTRVLPQCASVHAGAPLDMHYAHEHHRVLAGAMDFVEVPVTVDPDSRMWGGAHPQDLRVELVDAKNHWYTMDKAVARQRRDGFAVPYLRALTHNTFDYSDPRDFRRQTLEAVIGHARAIAERHGLTLTGATCDDLAARYRAAVPRAGAEAQLTLDRRGYEQTQA